MRRVCTGSAPRRRCFPVCEYCAAIERPQSCSHGDRMTSQSDNLLDCLSAKNVRRMNNLSHRLCCAPMMDRNDSFLISIRCNGACAQRVHEGAAIYSAGVRCSAISARRLQATFRGKLCFAPDVRYRLAVSALARMRERVVNERFQFGRLLPSAGIVKIESRKGRREGAQYAL